MSELPLHSDYCTLLSNEEDRDILTRKGFDVNMRLYKTSSQYYEIIEQIVNYIHWGARTVKQGYKKPHGFSGANAGIPFNIIALADGTVMLNPRIIDHLGRRTSISNCGSLLLEKPIEIARHAWVRVEYYDLAGNKRYVDGFLPTVQHEIDHNLGILITDRKVEP